MLDRVTIKRSAKEAMKQQWGTAIGATFLTSLIVGFISIFGLPLQVSMYGTMHKIYKREKADIGAMFNGFGENYLRKLGGMLLAALFTWLWLLLFIIPGIVKGIAYSMTAFILAEYPNVTASDAIKLSMRMTKGYKGEIFVMYLSFIGWQLLSVLTLGILSIVYVSPYMYTTYGGYYEELKKEALASGAISAEELQ